MDKRGAVTAFLIVGLILVIIGGMVFFMRSEYFSSLMGAQQAKAKAIPLELQPVNSYIESCIKSTANEGLLVIGQSGGYFTIPKESILLFPYYFYDNKSFVPELNRIESQLAEYVELMLPSCTGNFTALEGLEITPSQNINVRTKILKDEVEVTAGWDVSVKKGDYEAALSEFSADVPSRLYVIYSAARNLTEEQAKDPEYICISCMNSLAEENNLYIDKINYLNNTIIFKITDPMTKVADGVYYEFMFAYRY